MHPTATLFGQQVNLLAPTADDVRRYGRTAEFHEASICAVHQGLIALVQQFQMPDGKPIDLPPGMPAVLSLADADEAFRTAAPHAKMPGDLVPVLAGIVFEFDSGRNTNRSRVRQVNGVWMMVESMAKAAGFRPRVIGNSRPALTDQGRLARFGTAMWRPNQRQYHGMTSSLTTRQIDGIFAERDRCISDPERRPVLVGAN